MLALRILIQPHKKLMYRLDTHCVAILKRIDTSNSETNFFNSKLVGSLFRIPRRNHRSVITFESMQFSAHTVACIVSIVSLAVLQICVEEAWKARPSIPDQARTCTYSKFTENVNMMVTTALFAISGNQALRIFLSTRSGSSTRTVETFLSAFCVNAMSGLSNVLIHYCSWGGVWYNMFG